MARQAVTTSSLPPSTSFTRVGISDSATAPTSQNQLVTMAPHHRRGSSRRKRSRPPVEASMFCWIVRPGAASPVRGISRLAPQHMSENTIISSANRAGSPPSLAAMPPTMVPSRMAMKVAPSTSALPAGSSERCRWSGRMPYLIGPNSEAMTPNRNSAKNRIGMRMEAEAEHRDQRDADLGQLEPLRHQGLVVAVGESRRRAPTGRRRAR